MQTFAGIVLPAVVHILSIQTRQLLPYDFLYHSRAMYGYRDRRAHKNTAATTDGRVLWKEIHIQLPQLSDLRRNYQACARLSA